MQIVTGDGVIGFPIVAGEDDVVDSALARDRIGYEAILLEGLCDICGEVFGCGGLTNFEHGSASGLFGYLNEPDGIGIGIFAPVVVVDLVEEDLIALHPALYFVWAG